MSVSVNEIRDLERRVSDYVNELEKRIEHLESQLELWKKRWRRLQLNAPSLMVTW